MSCETDMVRKLQRALQSSIVDCQTSANDFKNTPDVRQIFHVVSIILTELSNNLELHSD